MNDWEHHVARTSAPGGREDRRPSLGLLIVVSSAIATLILILWLVTTEVPDIAFR
ncbi:MAG TPA: hypothetical protein VE820_13215 [Sphingomicrobium sp.]|jgi:hypothetical protein|nr:hypothetical protein [Sphingomicrobium sp.]